MIRRLIATSLLAASMLACSTTREHYDLGGVPSGSGIAPASTPRSTSTTITGRPTETGAEATAKASVTVPASTAITDRADVASATGRDETSAQPASPATEAGRADAEHESAAAVSDTAAPADGAAAAALAYPHAAVRIRDAQTGQALPATESNPARTVTLAEVMAIAERDAAQVITAVARLDAAAGRDQAAMGELIPGVTVQFGVSRLDGNQVGSFGDEGNVAFNRYEPAVGLTYDLNPGAAVARSLAAAKETAAASLDIRDARRVAMLESATAYLELVLAEATSTIATGLEHDAERFMDIAAARAEMELGPGSDVARARVEVSRARQTRLLARTRHQTASVRLATLLRWSPRRELSAAEAIVKTLTIIDAVAHDGETDTMDRPDLRAALKRADAAQDRNVAAWWDLFGPDIDAAVGERLIGVDMDDLDNTFVARALVRMTFDFGELGRARAAAGDARAARENARALDERIQGEVEGARAELRNAAAAVPEAAQGAEAADRNHRIQLVRFEAGTGLGLEVIEAQQTRARARLALVESVLRYNAAQLRLLAALDRLSPDQLAAAR